MPYAGRKGGAHVHRGNCLGEKMCGMECPGMSVWLSYANHLIPAFGECIVWSEIRAEKWL